MPVDRTHKKFACDHPDCEKAFARPYDLERHKRTHCDPKERPFACPFEKCDFRANQLGGLKSHFNSIHENVRLPCGELGCDKTFSDPSSRTKHRKKFHSTPPEAGVMGNMRRRTQSHKRKRSAPYPVSVHARVARHVEEHSREDAKDILNQFATFAIQASGSSNAGSPTSDDSLSGPDTGPSTSHSAKAPSSSVYRRTQPSPCELPGVLHHANDVPADGWSFDKNIQLENQRACYASSESAPTAWGYPGVPVLYTRAPHQPSHQGLVHGYSQEGTGQYEEMQSGAPLNEASPFSCPGTGHVPPSDHLPPNSPSSAYSRPNPRMLFDFRLPRSIL